MLHFICLKMNICKARLLCFPFSNLEMLIFNAIMILNFFCSACSFDNEDGNVCSYDTTSVVFTFIIMRVNYIKYKQCILLLLL